MKENEFEKWLEEYVTRNGTRLQKRPRSDAKSRCKRVEKYEGDLDIHFKKDNMRSLLDTLAYSKGDQESGVSPQHSIPIDGNILNGTASLRNATNLYRQFCMDSQRNEASKKEQVTSMIKFLTTQGLNYYLEELLKNANSKITLISPFFKLQRRIKEILFEKKQQGVEIVFVCRTKDLQEPLDEFSTQIFDAPTLHAKCYMNENEAILTSLNLYEFSQQNNEEMGVYVTNSGDGSSMYTDILLEADRLSKKPIAPSTSSTEVNLGYEEKPKSDFELDLEIGIKYSAAQLQSMFNFPYQGSAGIKDSSSGDIVLFSNTGPTHYDDMEKEQVTYYQGQNTGGGSQKLIYGNKLLYESYKNPNVRIFFFKNNTYCGEFHIIQNPYMENGKWIFPIGKK